MKLSVLMITYNHEKFITQALESVLMQVVNFDYEIVIGEDCSTDDTRNIVLDYQQKYPEKIRTLLPEKNLGMLRNFVGTYEACQGDYVALLEGDDFWTSQNKLQVQVDFLDQNPGCVICFHAVQVVSEYEPSSAYVNRMPGGRSIFTLRDLLDENFIPNCSMMFREGLFGEFPDWFFQQSQGDWSLHILNAQYGDVGYLDEVMASYRVHAGGAWTGMALAEREESIIATYEAFNRHLEFRYDGVICQRMAEHYLELFEQYEIKRDIENFYRTVQGARTVIFRTSGGHFDSVVLRLWLWCYVPKLFRILRRIKVVR